MSSEEKTQTLLPPLLHLPPGLTRPVTPAFVRLLADLYRRDKAAQDNGSLYSVYLQIVSLVGGRHLRSRLPDLNDDSSESGLTSGVASVDEPLQRAGSS